MAAGRWDWNVAALIAVMGWLVSPIINLLLPKILSCLSFDVSEKLLKQQVEVFIIQDLEDTLHAVDEQRIMERANKSNSRVAALDKMAAMLRHALEETEDIFDDAEHKIVVGDILYGVVQTCIARLNSSCVGIARIVRSGSALLLQRARDWFLLRRSEEPVPANISAAASDEPVLTIHIASDEPVPVATSAEASDESVPVPVTFFGAASDEPVPMMTSSAAASDEPVPVTTSAAASDESVPVTTSAAASDEPAVPVPAPSDSSEWRLSCLSSSFDFFMNCCRSIFYWLVDAIKVARTYRDWSYKVVGIASYQENATVLDFVLTAISRRNLRKRLEKVEITISDVKKTPLLSVASKSAPNDIANNNKSKIRTASNRKVFGREMLRENIMAKLREIPNGDAPSSSTSPCYSVIGIYGIAGSGKTTFARYIQDYIKKECKEKLFDTIMCIHVSETFSVDVIFQEMLNDITKDSHTKKEPQEDRGGLKKKFKEALRGKRFFLILDDLWETNKNDPRLEELLSPLNVGMKGSKILVTARRIDAVRALCADEPIKMPDLDEDEYFSMFMHYALGGTDVADEEYIPVGRVIAKKLHRSPIAAVTVAGRLGTNTDISFWKNTANDDMLNDTGGALWWSYQPLNTDIRRCFEFCNIFPRRFKLRRDELVRLWIAEGLVKTSRSKNDMEDVAEGYIQELVSCSFLQPEVDLLGGYFKIHDLLHDLLDMVAGKNYYFRIENGRSQRGGNKGWKEDVPRDVRHLFVQNYDGELITEKILGLENLRTLIFYYVGKDTPVEEKVIESICKMLPKLRVLAIALGYCAIEERKKWSFPESISQLKHLRYLSFRIELWHTVILPRALNKLHHIQLLDFLNGEILEFTSAGLTNLRHIFCSCVQFPNIGRLISLRTLEAFTVRNEQGYEVKQLRDLNKLCGYLEISGLENVKSKEEALEANLAAKEGLTELALVWVGDDDTRCSPEIEAEVLEGLCPPVGLETLIIYGYKGSRYPDWMVGRQNGGPENLQTLGFCFCSQLGPGPELEAFPHLRSLSLTSCSWDTLPGNVEHLTSLKELMIFGCLNVRWLPTLPQSIEEFRVYESYDEFMKNCQTVGHPNWQKIEHIPKKTFEQPVKRSREDVSPTWWLAR